MPARARLNFGLSNMQLVQKYHHMTNFFTAQPFVDDIRYNVGSTFLLHLGLESAHEILVHSSYA